MEETKYLGLGPEVGHLRRYSKTKPRQKSPPFYADLCKEKASEEVPGPNDQRRARREVNGKNSNTDCLFSFPANSSALLSVMKPATPPLSTMLKHSFHEFGHGHSTTCFTKQTDLSTSGIADVEWDA